MYAAYRFIGPGNGQEENEEAFQANYYTGAAAFFIFELITFVLCIVKQADKCRYHPLCRPSDGNAQMLRNVKGEHVQINKLIHSRSKSRSKVITLEMHIYMYTP